MQYFFQVKLYHLGITATVALISNYSAPDKVLLEKSSGALAVCKYQDQGSLEVIKIESIVAVVGMVPYPHTQEKDLFFLVERMGLDIAYLGGYREEMTNEGEGEGDNQQQNDQ